MLRTKPPFRADHAGSLLRPQKISEARAKFARQQISADELRRIEDMEIEKLVHKQSAIGLQLATDGELRRGSWHLDFFAGLSGCELYHSAARSPDERPDAVRVVGTVDFPDDHPVLEEFRVLQRHAGIAHVTPKLTIPSPVMLHFYVGRAGTSPQAYPQLDGLLHDLAKAYRKAVRALYDAGCRYLQFDDTVWADLCSPDVVQQMRERGDNPDQLPQLYSRIINYAIAERPADMVITTHVCRSNGDSSSWLAAGGYEPIAETLFARTNYDGYLLEYAEGAGGFAPLRFLPRGPKVAMIGAIAAQDGELESKDDLKRKLQEAAQFVPLEQLALAPQSGFAFGEQSTPLSEQAQWDKLRLAVEVAQEVWGR